MVPRTDDSGNGNEYSAVKFISGIFFGSYLSYV